MYRDIVILSGYFTESLGSPSEGEIGLTNLAHIYMNEWFLIYTAIAISGALISWYKIFLPVRLKLTKDGLNDHPYVSNLLITSIVWLIAATVLIPFIASALLFEDKKAIFIASVYEGAK